MVEWIDCRVLKAAVHRAFASWSANHAHISFVDVTAECEAIGMLEADCPLAEVWVTSLRLEAQRGRSMPDATEASADDEYDIDPVYWALSSHGSVSEAQSGESMPAATATPPRWSSSPDLPSSGS